MSEAIVYCEQPVLARQTRYHDRWTTDPHCGRLGWWVATRAGEPRQFVCGIHARVLRRQGWVCQDMREGPVCDSHGQ